MVFFLFFRLQTSPSYCEQIHSRVQRILQTHKTTWGPPNDLWPLTSWSVHKVTNNRLQYRLLTVKIITLHLKFKGMDAHKHTLILKSYTQLCFSWLNLQKYCKPRFHDVMSLIYENPYKHLCQSSQENISMFVYACRFRNTMITVQQSV